MNIKPLYHHMINLLQFIFEYGLYNFLKLIYKKIIRAKFLAIKIDSLIIHVNNDESSLYHLLNSYKKIKKCVDYLPEDTKYIVDIGANCGWFSLLAKKRFPDAQIVAFEPSPNLLEILEKNFFETDIILIKKAVSFSSGKVSFYINPRSEQTNSVYKEHVEVAAGSGDVQTFKIDVSTIALDDCVEISQWERIDVIKIDVQGSELDVLKGAEKNLKKTLSLIVEIWLLDKECINTLKLIDNIFHYHKYVNPVYAGADIFFTKVKQYIR